MSQREHLVIQGEERELQPSPYARFVIDTADIFLHLRHRNAEMFRDLGVLHPLKDRRNNPELAPRKSRRDPLSDRICTDGSLRVGFRLKTYLSAGDSANPLQQGVTVYLSRQYPGEAQSSEFECLLGSLGEHQRAATSRNSKPRDGSELFHRCEKIRRDKEEVRTQSRDSTMQVCDRERLGDDTQVVFSCD